MRDLNRTTLIGRLGADPIIRYTPSGVAVANFDICTNDEWKDKDGNKQKRATWHKIVMWRGLAETAKNYLHKGKQIYVEGPSQTRSWEDKDGITRYTTEVVVKEMQMLGSKGEGKPKEDKDDPGPSDADDPTLPYG